MFKDFFKRMLSEDNGTPSQARWSSFQSDFMIWVLIFAVCFVVYKGLPEALIYAVCTVIGTVAGIYKAFKWAQKRYENGQLKNEQENK